MDAERWARLDELFHRLRTRPKDSWPRLVMRTCADDAELQSELLSLLEEDRGASDFLEASRLDQGLELLRRGSRPEPTRSTLARGEQLGRYRIVRLIDSGGSAEVYEALQDAPERTVALKVLSPRIGQVGSWRRFESEARILAKLSHPAIAQIYDVGLHELGPDDEAAPYFVMEYVEAARPLTRYAAEQGLDLRDRLELFLEVCRAVGYGHQRGVIHRDLKPSNILVDGSGRPKIIDFGVARVTEDREGARDQTSRMELVGTLQYMSPEQCGAEPDLLDTRTDVYSLGVVLYELVTGELPYRVAGLSIPSALRLIQEAPIRRPSAHRSTLNGELETILLTALSKDPDGRYDSVAKLQEDVERFLRHEPILARAPSTLYRLRKLVRRHRVTTALSCALILAILTGFIGISSALIEARRQRDAALASNDRANEILGFLGTVIASPHDDFEGQDVSMSAVLDRAARGLDAGEVSGDEAEWTLRQLLARSYESQGHYTSAFEQFERALAIARRSYGEEDLRVAELRVDLGGSCHDLFRLEEALALLTRALQTQSRRLGSDHLTTLRTRNYLGLVYLDSGRVAEAERELEAVLAGRRAALGPDHDDVWQSQFNLGIVKAERGKHEEAEAVLREALDRCSRQPDPSARRLSGLQLRLGTVVAARGDMDEAERLINAGAATYQAAYAADHPNVAATHHQLGWMLLNRGEPERAQSHLEQSVATFRRQFGAEHRWTLRAGVLLGAAYRLQGRHDEAIETLEQLVDTVRGSDSLGDAELADPLLALARAHYFAGQLDEASRLSEELFEHTRSEEPTAPGTWLSNGNLRAMIALDRGQPEESLALIDEALERPVGDSYDSAWMTADLMVTRACCFLAQQRLDESFAILVDCLEELEQSPPWRDDRAKRALEQLAAAYRDRGRGEQAARIEALLEEE